MLAERLAKLDETIEEVLAATEATQEMIDDLADQMERAQRLQAAWNAPADGRIQ